MAVPGPPIVAEFAGPLRFLSSFWPAPLTMDMIAGGSLTPVLDPSALSAQSHQPHWPRELSGQLGLGKIAHRRR